MGNLFSRWGSALGLVAGLFWWPSNEALSAPAPGGGLAQRGNVNKTVQDVEKKGVHVRDCSDSRRLVRWLVRDDGGLLCQVVES